MGEKEASMSDTPPVVPAVDAAGSTVPTTPAITPATPSDGELKVSWKEFVELKKTQRDTLAILQQMQDERKAKAEAKAKTATPVAATPDDAMAMVRELEFKLAVKDAISSAGISDPKFSKLIEQAARAEKPADLMAFVADYTPVAPKAVAVVAPVVLAKSTDTGAALPAPISPNLPADPTKWPEDVVKRTPTAEWIAAFQAFKASQRGRSYNPYENIKRPHEK